MAADTNLTKCIPFLKQPLKQRCENILKFEKIFEASGCDFGSLLVYYLETTKIGREVNDETRQALRLFLQDMVPDVNKQLDAIMDSIRALHASSSDREKLRIMSLVAPICTRAELLRRGFVVSNDAFANARKHALQNGAGAPVATGGRPRIYTSEMAAIVANFCNHPDNSAPIIQPNNPINNHLNPSYHEYPSSTSSPLLSSMNTSHMMANNILFETNDTKLQGLSSNDIAQDSTVGNNEADCNNGLPSAIVDFTKHFLPTPNIISPKMHPNPALNTSPQLRSPNSEDSVTIARTLKHPVSLLYARFQQAYPDIHITYQALRSMVPPYIIKRSRDMDDDLQEGTPRKRKGRLSAMANSTEIDATENQINNSINNVPTSSYQSVNDLRGSDNSVQHSPSTSLLPTASSSSSQSPGIISYVSHQDLLLSPISAVNRD